MTSGVQTVFNEPDSERRADQIASADKPYRLELRAGQTLPTIDIYSQAPTVAGAERLADAVIPGMREYLAALADKQGADPKDQVQLAQLGPARGAIANSGTKLQIAGLAFLVAFALSGAAAYAVARWRARRAAAPAAAEPVGEASPAAELNGGMPAHRWPAALSGGPATGRAPRACSRG